MVSKTKESENLSEKWQKLIPFLYDNLDELKKSYEAYNIDLNVVNNSTEVISKRFYSEFFIMAAIFEGFNTKIEISLKELYQSIYNFIPKELFITIIDEFVFSVIKKMIILGYIKPIKKENEYIPYFGITKKGINIYEGQQIQSIAASSFFSYHTMELSKKTEELNKKIFWLTILMLIATICSIIVTIYSINK